jgi:apolipoprotein N-acyltransferase
VPIAASSALVWAVRGASSARAAGWMGLLFATAWLSTTFWWLFIALHTYGGLPAVLAALAIVLLAAALGFYYAVACAAFWRWRKLRPALAAMAFAALWTMAELARGTWLTGFGWGAVGYAHVDGPLAWFYPWVGSYGVGGLAAWLAACLAMLLRRGGWWALPGVAVLLLLPLFAPVAWNSWTEPTGTLSVTLLQGNIPQDEKFEQGSGVPLALQWYAEQLQLSRSALVVAPETAVPLLPQQLPEGYLGALEQRFSNGQAALIGMPLGSYAQGYTNSVIGLAAGQTQPWRYDKHHLVPFGEFIPPLFKWFTRMMNIPLGDFNRGGLGQPSLPVAGQRVAPNICYEDLYGEELATRFGDPALAPTVFANVSNLGWFNNSVAIDQHLAISRVRALEFQRPFVRATNTGATVILDHQGTVLKALPRLTRGVLEGEVQGRTGTTPFAWWASRLGLWPLWILCLAVCLLAWRNARSLR